MRRWTRLLPFCVVAWLAKRRCARTALSGYRCTHIMARPYQDTLILVETIKKED